MPNIMDEYVKFMEKSLLNYYKMIYDKKFNKAIATRFIDTYVYVRYGNYVDEESKKLNIAKKISRALDFTARDLKAENDNDLTTLIDSYKTIAMHFYNIDQLYLLEAQKKTVNDISIERNRFLSIEDTKFINEFSNVLREDIKKKKDYLDAFESNTFNLDIKKYNKSDYGLILANSIVFPDLYSDVAVKRAAEKDSISEDMTAIGFLQASTIIINDLISCDFDKSYYIDLPGSFFDKKTKVARLFNIIDNTFIQDRLRIVIDYACFERYKSYVMDFMRQGFVFAIYLDDKFDYSSENIKFLELFDRIFIEKSKYYYKDMKNNGKIRDRIITIDEVK